MKFFKDLAKLAVGEVASKLVVFLVFAWLARVLDPDGYGAVEYVVGLAVFFATVVDSGLGAISVRRAAHTPSALPLLAHQIRIARLLLVAAVIPIMIVVAMATMKSTAPHALVWLFALGLLAVPWCQDWLFQATERMGWAAAAQFLRVCAFAMLVLALVKGPRDVVAVGWAELGAAATMTAFCLYYQHTRITPLLWRGSMHGFASLAKEGAALGTTNILWAMNRYAPLFMIGSAIGGAATAWFAAATRVIASLIVFSYLYHFSLYPAVARATARKGDELAVLLTGSCRLAAWGGMLGALALTLFAEPLIVFAMGEKMAPAAPMLRIMAWMLPVSLCSGHARAALVAAGAQTRVLWSQVAALAVTVAIALVLGPRHGGVGYAYAALDGFVAVWVAMHFHAERIGASPPSFLLVLKPVLLATVIVAAHEWGWPGPWTALAGIAVFAAAAPLLDRNLGRDVRALGNAKLAFGDTGRI